MNNPFEAPQAIESNEFATGSDASALRRDISKLDNGRLRGLLRQSRLILFAGLSLGVGGFLLLLIDYGSELVFEQRFPKDKFSYGLVIYGISILAGLGVDARLWWGRWLGIIMCIYVALSAAAFCIMFALICYGWVVDPTYIPVGIASIPIFGISVWSIIAFWKRGDLFGPRRISHAALVLEVARRNFAAAKSSLPVMIPRESIPPPAIPVAEANETVNVDAESTTRSN